MFRFLLKVGALAGSLGIGYQYVDQSSMQSVLDSIGSWRQVVSGKSDASGAQPGSTTGEDAPQDATRVDDAPRAFHGAAPSDCHAERIIEPSDGSVRCAD